MFSRIFRIVGRVVGDSRELDLTLRASGYTDRDYASLHFGWTGFMFYGLSGSVLALGVNWRDGFARIGPVSVNWSIPVITCYSFRFALGLTVYDLDWNEFDVFEFLARKGRAARKAWKKVKAA